MTHSSALRAAARLALGASLLGGCTAEISPDEAPSDASVDVDAEASPSPEDAGADAVVERDAGEGDSSAPADAEADAAPPPMTHVCSPDGWCFARPLPTADGLRGAFAAADGEVWMVGERGSIMAFDGVGFQAVTSPTDQTLHAAFSVADGSSWVVGDGGTALHYADGSIQARALEDADAGTTSKAEANLFGVHGAAEDDVWLVGDLGAAWHFDGTRFEPRHLSSAQPLRAVWSDGEHTLAVGDAGHAFVFNPEDDSWMQLPTDTPAHLTAIAGDSADDLWVVGAQGSVLHYDGESFAALEPPSEDDLFAAIVRKDGSLWVAGANGALFSHDGADWTPRSSGLGSPLRALTEIGATLWTLGDHGGVASWQGDARTRYSEGGDESWLDLVPIDADRLWVVGDGLLQGMPFAPAELPSARIMFAGFGLSKDAVWLAGTYGTAFHWDGSSWTELPALTRRVLRDVWAADAAHAFIVGERGTLMALDEEGEFVLLDTPDARDLLSVFGTSSDDVWAVGIRGAALHFDGSEWSAVDTGLRSDLRAVHATAPDDVWAVGTLGTIAHFDGADWAVLAEGETYSLNGVFARAPDDVYAVGTRGTLLHFDGESFVPEDVGTQTTLQAVNAHDDRIYVAGHGGVVLFRE